MPKPAPVDAHIHLANLSERDPGFPARFAASGIRACASSHTPEEFLWTEIFRNGNFRNGNFRNGNFRNGNFRNGNFRNGTLLGGAFRNGALQARPLRAQDLAIVASFGIHPQWPVMEHADFLAELAAAGRIDVVGEAGFDFFGDRPDRVRGAETEASQRRAFEFQLELAIDRGLPLLLHVRKGMDLVFGYSKRLKLLPAAIFHSWSGTPGEAEAFLRRGIRAYFSFGSTVLNGHKRAIESLRTIPDSAILSETDAPWQPPKGSPFCRFEDIGRVIAGMATIRQTGVEPLMVLIEHNWDSIFGTAPERYGDARHEDAKSPGQGRAGDRSADHGPGGA